MQRLQRITSHIAPAESKLSCSQVNCPYMEHSKCPHYNGSNSTQQSGKKQPIKVVLTGAAGNIGYALIFQIGQGRMLGADQPIDLVLLDIPASAKKLTGVHMEIVDCAFPVFSSVVATTDYKVAFEDAQLCLLVGARPRGPGMVRADLLKANAPIFAGQGKAINAYAHPNVKVVVVGNPANTNALVVMRNAPRVPQANFTALTRLDQNRAVGQIANRLGGVPVANIRNITVWGNHSASQYDDVNNAYVVDYPQTGLITSVRAAVGDDAWLQGEFLSVVQKRGAAIIGARGASSAASAANGVVDHVRSWFLGTAPGEWVSMAVVSDGSYNTPKGVIFSFPVQCKNGNWKIVQGLNIDAFSADKIRKTGEELVAEENAALGGN